MAIPVLVRAALCVSFCACCNRIERRDLFLRGSRGMIVYQNFPCEFTSRGSVPASGFAETTPSAPTTPGAATVARNATADKAPTQPAVQTTVASNTGPQPGMSEDDVRKAWGEPEEVIQDEPPSGRVDISALQGRPLGADQPEHRVVAVQLDGAERKARAVLHGK